MSFEPRTELFWVPLLALALFVDAGAGAADGALAEPAAQCVDMSAFVDNFHFLRPWGLLLVVPAFVLWWLARRAADTTRRWSEVIDPALLRALVVGGAGGARFGPHDLLLLAWLAIARSPSPGRPGSASRRPSPSRRRPR